ncbi:MAG TPA: hypothetical protein VHO48_06025, partial [Anaerolineaceae bacterium]|nr:hypothetical protein [Anaerolineaceae bacterium]
ERNERPVIQLRQNGRARRPTMLMYALSAARCGRIVSQTGNQEPGEQADDQTNDSKDQNNFN